MSNAYLDPTNVGNFPGNGPLRAGGVNANAPSGENTKNLPSTMSAAAMRQASALRIVRDLEEGNEQVKRSKEAYLPRDPAEDPTNYEARLKRSAFFNVFLRTVEGLIGMIFVKDPVLGSDVPVQIAGAPAKDTAEREAGHWENIDNAGTHGDVFCRDVAQDALTAGHAAILVEYPTVDGIADYEQSRAEADGTIRPYWVPILKDNMVSWRTAVVNGKTILTQLVLKECHMVADGDFGEKEQTRYRVFRNGFGLVTFQLLEVTESQSVQIVAEGSYPTQNEIPIAEIITSGRKSMFVSNPPLIDLAYLNIAYYQEWSDARNARHLTCVPFLFTAGITIDEGESLVVGPNSTVSAPDSQAKAAYVAHDGAALQVCKEALDDLKSDMGTLGLSMLAPQKRAAETAAAKRLDARGSDSALGVTSRGVQDGVERALYFHARYMNLPSGGSIAINRSFDETIMDAQTMAAYADLADKIGLPLRQVLEALQQGGRIRDDVDLDALEAETAANKAARDAEKARQAQDSLALLQSGTPADQQPKGGMVA